MKFTKKLTKKQIAIYIKDPLRCLFCQQPGVRSNLFAGDGFEEAVAVSCPSCGQEWADVWTLTSVDTVDIHCPVCDNLIEEGQDVELTADNSLRHSTCLES